MAIVTSSATTSDPRSRWLCASALGGIAWTAAVALLWPGQDADGRTLAGVQLLLSPLALLPLAVALIGPESGRLWRCAAWTQLPAAALLVGSFALPVGPVAATFAAPWLGFTGLLAWCGLLRLTASGLRNPAELAVIAGLVYVAIGGAWTFASRLGLGFLGFEEPLVLLTGAHFHYAGLLLPILTGLAARNLGDTPANLACFAVMVAVPLVAVGITLGARGVYVPDLVAALLMTATGFVVAILQLRLAKRATGPLPRVLFAISGGSLLVGMLLAGIYAVGNYAHRVGHDLGGEWLTIPQMIRSHAAVNVFGFALPGLLAWLVSAERDA